MYAIVSVTHGQDFIDIIEMPIDDAQSVRATKDNISRALERGIMFEFSLGCTFRGSRGHIS